LEPANKVGETGTPTRGHYTTERLLMDLQCQKNSLRVILGLDPRIHLLTGLRVPARDNANAAALATVRQPLNHPASR